MHTINAEQLKSVIEHTVIGLNEPIIVVGAAGAGKTAAIGAAAKEFGCHLEPTVAHPGSGVVLLGQYDTVDLKGTPWLAKLGGTEYKSTVWHPASTLPFVGNPNFPDDQDIILFLDEITSASIPVMGLCYQLIHERRIGEHVLMERVRIICAGNRETDKGIVNRMPMPLCNRLTWFEMGSDVKSWSAWASETYGPAADITVAFLNFRKPLLHTYDPAVASKTFASPRTWEKVIKYMGSTMPQDIKMAATAGAVGDGPAAELWGFVDVWHKVVKILPTILKSPETAHVPDELSMRYALAVSCSGSMTDKNARAYYTYLCRLDPEYVILAMQLAVKRNTKIFESEVFADFAKRFKTIWN